MVLSTYPYIGKGLVQRSDRHNQQCSTTDFGPARPKRVAGEINY